MNLRVAVTGKAKCQEARNRSESESEQGEVPPWGKAHICAEIESEGVDAKPSDLPMVRLKVR